MTKQRGGNSNQTGLKNFQPSVPRAKFCVRLQTINYRIKKNHVALLQTKPPAIRLLSIQENFEPFISRMSVQFL